MSIVYVAQSKSQTQIRQNYTKFSYIDFFYIVTFFDRGGLYCSSKNLFTTFTKVTPFCVMSGKQHEDVIWTLYVEIHTQLDLQFLSFRNGTGL